MAIYLKRGARIEDSTRLSALFSGKTQGHRLCSPDTILKMLSDKFKYFHGIAQVDVLAFYVEGACASAGRGWTAALMPEELSTSSAGTAASSTKGP